MDQGIRDSEAFLRQKDRKILVEFLDPKQRSSSRWTKQSTFTTKPRRNKVGPFIALNLICNRSRKMPKRAIFMPKRYSSRGYNFLGYQFPGFPTDEILTLLNA